MSGASERANGRASGSVLTSGFLVDLAHSEMFNYKKNVLYNDLFNIFLTFREHGRIHWALFVVVNLFPMSKRAVTMNCQTRLWFLESMRSLDT